MKIVEVIREITSGGFGLIEEVRCDNGEHYARKTFSPSSNNAIDERIYNESKNRFIREVKTQKILAQKCVDHQFIMPIIYEDLDADKPFYLMPLAEHDYNVEIKKSKN